MNYYYIVNPLTNRKCSIHSQIGKKILNNYISQSGGALSQKEKDEKSKILKNANVYAPEGYFTGLTVEETKKRLERMKEGTKKSHKDASAYKDFETDFRDGERIKTKLSGYTKQWRKYFPNATSLEEKAKLTGVPFDIIEKVYNKGLAAWRTGHRPGATGQQWGYARVHSFLVKGKAYYTADNYLAKEAIKRSRIAKEWFEWVEGLCDGEENRDKYKWCKKACSKSECR
uniref:DUF5824 domain-containing protein n=1 Tax=viral metagenome TaxID=1070528 RepID=A0A6C0JEB3_9ZZZZ